MLALLGMAPCSRASTAQMNQNHASSAVLNGMPTDLLARADVQLGRRVTGGASEAPRNPLHLF
jgi:hypothetical protein